MLAAYKPVILLGFHRSFHDTRTSSSQATYRLRRAFSFYYKAHRALILLLLASNCDPLRWARSWWAALRAAFFSIQKYRFQHPLPKRKDILSDVLLFWVPPPRERLHPWDFNARSRLCRPRAKVFARGENAYTAQMCRQPEGCIDFPSDQTFFSIH